MKYIKENFKNKRCNHNFICINCGSLIYPAMSGTDHRNHCPHCLCSKHLDELPGDRAAVCHGNMKPISIWVKDNEEWSIVHRCQKCGKLSVNRVAPDDNEELLLALARKPLLTIPFPSENLEKGGKNNG
jgi:DNA-directed RNA polymerase subunit M/transcription elongation factor TFIIS